MEPPEPAEARAVRLVIRGRVQGVGFRAWAAGQAELHGLAGWVRNRHDGSVELLLSGPAEAVELMVRACRDGPRDARVEQAEEYPPDPGDDVPASGFELRATA